MKSSNIGGQAVMEGVMMKNGEKYAVAVRKPDHEIEVMISTFKSSAGKRKITRIPFIRGIFSFIDSMVLGMKTLTYSADFFLDEEEEEKEEKSESKETKESDNSLLMAGTVVLAVIMAVGLFIGIPFLAAEGLRRFVTQNEWIIVSCEGLIRLALFLIYVVAISQMEDIKRVYMYHGAEHKCINCVEHGLELNVENVRNSSRLHKRCGTSFLLFVMLISIIVGFLIQCESPWLRLLFRILMIPVVAGVAYELIKWAGNSDNPVVSVLSKPGLLLQRITTGEPDDEMIEVGIRSVEAVFDWRAYLRENGIEVASPETQEQTADSETSYAPDADNSAETMKSETGAAI